MNDVKFIFTKAVLDEIFKVPLTRINTMVDEFASMGYLDKTAKFKRTLGYEREKKRDEIKISIIVW